MGSLRQEYAQWFWRRTGEHESRARTSEARTCMLVQVALLSYSSLICSYGIKVRSIYGCCRSRYDLFPTPDIYYFNFYNSIYLLPYFPPHRPYAGIFFPFFMFSSVKQQFLQPFLSDLTSRSSQHLSFVSLCFLLFFFFSFSFCGLACFRVFWAVCSRTRYASIPLALPFDELRLLGLLCFTV